MQTPFAHHCRSLIAGLAALLSLAACKQERKGAPPNWHELCAIDDCERYPLGFWSIEMGRREYRLPIAPSNSIDPGSRKIFSDFNPEEGRLLRGRALKAGSFDIMSCCSEIEAALGLPESGRIAGRLIVSTYDSSSSIDEDAVLAMDEETFHSLPSWNDDFYDVSLKRPADPDATPHHAYDRVRLVSKRPVYFDWRVWVDCGVRYCDAGLVGYPYRHNFPPGISLINIYPVEEAYLCDVGTKSCPTRDEVIAGIPDDIRAIQRIIETATASEGDEPPAAPALPREGEEVR